MTAARSVSEKVSDHVNVAIHLDQPTYAFYSRVAELARTDMSTALCIALAMPLIAKPLQRSRRKATKK